LLDAHAADLPTFVDQEKVVGAQTIAADGYSVGDQSDLVEAFLELEGLVGFLVGGAETKALHLDRQGSYFQPEEAVVVDPFAHYQTGIGSP
jgi:hypothetical protein